MVWKVIVNMNVKQCFDAIEKLSKDEFHQKILRGVAATTEFSYLVCIGVEHVTEEQKKRQMDRIKEATGKFLCGVEEERRKSNEKTA